MRCGDQTGRQRGEEKCCAEDPTAPNREHPIEVAFDGSPPT
jgi:hypothetical protein